MSGILLAFAGAGGAAPPGQTAYTTAGTYTWVAPAGVTNVSVVAVGAGFRGTTSSNGGAGGGGALAYRNSVSVSPGTSYTVVVGNPCGSRDSSILCMIAGGSTGRSGGSPSGTYTGGGSGGTGGTGSGGGGGAGGYAGAGGNGGPSNVGMTCRYGFVGNGGGGGGGGGACNYNYRGGGGGGVGILGQGTSGARGVTSGNNGGYGSGGSGGANGTNGVGCPCTGSSCGYGGAYGGGAGASWNYGMGFSGTGAVRIIWPGTTRTFPSTCTGDK